MDDNDAKTDSGLSRRQFLQRLGAVAGSALISACAPRLTRRTTTSSRQPGNGQRPPKKLIYVAVDSLHPQYLLLDAHGRPGGRDGNWLMPNFRKFLGRAVQFTNAKCFLPSVTDANHLNAVAGTCAGLTGILGVRWQFQRWGADGKPVLVSSDLSLARDDRGRPVDTIFHAWKRRWPDSPTACVSGKGWVAAMFGAADPPVVDHLITGADRPDYLKKPPRGRFADPPPGGDASCEPHSPMGRPPSLWDGQHGLMTQLMEMTPKRFPHDAWIVDASLELFAREKPDLAYLLLAQTDDAGHAIGAAWDPDEFVPPGKPYVPPRGCANLPEYQLVSGRNADLYLDPILNAVRDTDRQFGRLLDGLTEQGVLNDAVVVLLSDHAMTNYLHRGPLSSTDFSGRLEDAGLADAESVRAIAGCSVGAVYWRDGKHRVPAAKTLLLDHRARNLQTGRVECPWWVLDRDDMRRGAPGVALPGELYHPYLIAGESRGLTAWPDLFIFAKNGWQVPCYHGMMLNTAMKLPDVLPPQLPFNAGHGSVDTLPIVAAVAAPGGAGRLAEREIRIADLAVTAAALFGLELRSTVVGRDLRADLG